MRKSYPEICANCANWDFFEVDFDLPEDECGGCRVHDGEVTYGDDERCEDFDSLKRPRVRHDFRKNG